MKHLLRMTTLVAVLVTGLAFSAETHAEDVAAINTPPSVIDLKDMYRQLLAVGTDNDIPGSLDTGSWLIENMTVGGD